jgi:PKD repeat protein
MHAIQTILVAFILLITLVLSPLATASSGQAEENDDVVKNENSYYPLSTSAPLSRGAFDVPPIYIQNAIKGIIPNVSPQNLKSYVTKLQNFGSRLYRAPGMFNASIWLHDVLKGNGRLEAEYHNFTIVRPTWGTFTLSNVILTLPGLNQSSDRIFYMFAHSDAVQFTDSNQWLTNTPGADDDASGCSAALEAARVLSRHKFQDTIKFAFFNAEEIGLVGSNRYAANMSAWGENVVGSIDYDMIGYSVGSYEYDLTLRWNPASADQGLYEVGVNDRYNIGLSLDAAETSSNIPSDIQSFYNNGFPGVFGIEYDFSPYYHSTSDLVKYLNMTLIEKCTKLAVASLAEMARLMFTDLTVLPGDLTVSNTKPIVGESVNVSVNIINSGNLNASDVEVVFYSAGEPFASKRISVPAYGVNSTNVTWNATMGFHNITVSVDPKNEIIEADETNNTAWMHVLVNDIPKCVFTATPTKVYTSEAIRFNGTNSYDLFGGVIHYKFLFGDGNGTGWVNSSLVTHAYSDDGLFTASLMVRDEHGLESLPVNISIIVLNQAPLANPGSNVTITRTRAPIQFYSNASDPDGEFTLLWKFGDGSKSNEPAPIFSYNESGDYSVELFVVDDDNASTKYLLNIEIRNRPPICDIDVNILKGNITSEFIFTPVIKDLDSELFNIQWFFGDGKSNERLTTKIENTSHLYSHPGTYLVSLRVSDPEGAEASANITVTVTDLPPVAIAKVTPIIINTSEEVTFSGLDSYDLEGPVTYYWFLDYGSGLAIADDSFSLSFTTPGEITGTLKVSDNSGQSNIISLPTITVLNRPPMAKFLSMGDLIESETIYFDASQSTDPEGSITYLWEFESGKISTVGPVTTNIFPKPGIYTVTLKVTDEHGDTSTMYEVIEIKARSDEPIPNGSSNGDSNGTKPGDNGLTKEDDRSESDSFIYILLATNIIFIVLFIIFLVFSLIAKRKNKEDELSDRAPGPPGEPPPIQDHPPPTQEELLAPPVMEPLPDRTVQYGNGESEVTGIDDDYFAPLPKTQQDQFVQPQPESLPEYSASGTYYQEPPPPPPPSQQQTYQEYIPPPSQSEKKNGQEYRN